MESIVAFFLFPLMFPFLLMVWTGNLMVRLFGEPERKGWQQLGSAYFMLPAGVLNLLCDLRDHLMAASAREEMAFTWDTIPRRNRLAAMERINRSAPRTSERRSRRWRWEF